MSKTDQITILEARIKELEEFKTMNQKLNIQALDIKRKQEAKLQKEIERREAAEKALKVYGNGDGLGFHKDLRETAREHFKKYERDNTK